MGTFVGADLSLSGVAREMGRATETWFSGAIQIVDPQIADNASDFNAFTNADTSAGPILIWEGAARIKPIRFPRPATSGFADTELRIIDFQIIIDPAISHAIRKGMQIYVTDGGNDPSLVEFQYVVRTSINGSDNWIRTIQCAVDAGATGTFLV
jgi:hypothetical protein